MPDITTISPQIEESWGRVLQNEFMSDYFVQLKQFLLQEKRNRVLVCPAGKNIFNAFYLTPFYNVKVVILGQDPYHGPNQAHGLAFSVRPGVPVPPSLNNIFKELEIDLGMKPPIYGDLSDWAQQGVLLLNTVLTVRSGQAHSHHGRGWEYFTDAVIKKLSDQQRHLVFVLWGSQAQTKQILIDRAKHLILTAPHPSPLSAYRGFFGCRHFSKINEYLITYGRKSIDWGGCNQLRQS